MTDPCDELHAYVDGELHDAELAGFEAHLLTCKTCQAELPRLLTLLAALDNAAAVAANAEPPVGRFTVIDGGAPEARAPEAPEVKAPAPRTVRRGRMAWMLGAPLAAAAALLLWLAIRPTQPPPPRFALGPTRTIEARLGYPGTGDYRRQDPQRAAGPATASDQLLGLQLAFERARDWHGVAVAALLAGDPERARQAFARAPSTPDVDADRAALERALDDVDRALAAAPSNAAAHWNRALVLAAMNLPLAAAREFDGIRARGEPGWADEARTRADALRAQLVQRRAHWKRASDAAERLVADGTSVPDELTDVAGTVTVMFYDAVRSAPSRERVLALLPLAGKLDRAYRSPHLAAYVEHIAESDFRVRAPLADRYREIALVRAAPGAANALLAQLPASGADDIRMGTLVYAGRVAAQLDEYRRLAAATDDPWFALIAEYEAANAEIARHETAAAERRLRDAIALARRERMALRALRLENKLIQLLESALELSQAADLARDAYRDAVAAGEWVDEVNTLNHLATIQHNRHEYGLARAYLTELAERAEAGLSSGTNAAMDCVNRVHAYGSLANLSVLQREYDRARAELARIPACDARAKPEIRAGLILRDALVRSELYRSGHRPEDAQRARDSLAALRELPSAIDPGKAALVAYLEGNLAIKDDPPAGRKWLREAITLAGDQTGELAVKARAYSFSLLALEAARASAFDQVFAAVAEALNVHAPGQCALSIAADAERSVVAFRDAAGATGGQYVDARPPGALDIASLVPPGVADRLRSCARISVLARAPVLGAGRLLPPEFAWSYLLTDPSPAAAPARTAGHRVVIANPETPPELNLSPLRPYPDEPGSTEVTVLRGANATPSRVVVAMQDASVIEFHTHGIIADDLLEASQLVLSPELDRQYALAPRDVAGVHLSGSPLVILGACHAATSSRVLEGGMGLAEAFLRAGARAVIASPETVQDLGAYAFFAAIRDRVLRGADPALALRDERMRHVAASHDDTWVSGMVVFQ